jgi:hypothetical protein
LTAPRGWPDLRQNHIHGPGQANSAPGALHKSLRFAC